MRGASQRLSQRLGVSAVSQIFAVGNFKKSQEQSMAEVIVSSDGFLKQRITAGNHTLTADEPREAGGSDAGPDPVLVLARSSRGLHFDDSATLRAAQGHPAREGSGELEERSHSREGLRDMRLQRGKDRANRTLYLAHRTAHR